MKTQFLVEKLQPSESNILTESIVNELGTKDMYLHGIFMQAAQKNRNGRIYPLTEMVNAVAALNEQIRTYGSVAGELDHPADRLTVAMDRASHLIKELYMDGNNVIGKAILLDTPMGLIAKDMSKKGFRYGVSSRGAGQVNESTGEVSGFKLVTIDIVATPSAHGAMPNTIYEALEDYKNGKVLTLAEAVRNDPAAQKYFSEEMHRFLLSLRGK